MPSNNAPAFYKSKKRTPGTSGAVFFMIVLVGGCSLPTLRIEGTIVVKHEVIHKMAQTSEAQGTSTQTLATLRDWKSVGLVGERYDGYLGMVQENTDPTIEAQVNEKNAKRKERYLDILKKSPDTTLEFIQEQAGLTLIKRELPGVFVFLKDQGWQRKE